MEKKNFVLIPLILLFLTIFSTSIFGISLPEKAPDVIGKTTQKDKAAVVLIRSIVSGTTAIPSYEMVQGGAGEAEGIVGTWRSVHETVTFTEDGQFSGNNVQTGALSGTYSIQGNILTVNYVMPYPGTAQFTYSISGNTLTLSSAQGSEVYTRIGVEGTETDIVSRIKSLQLVRETGSGAKILTQEVKSGASGTGFIVSPDGYIVTNAHVVLANQDPQTMLLNTFAQGLEQELYTEASKYYNIPQEDKEKIVGILLAKFMSYFSENGQITDITTNYYVLNGVASPGEELEIKSWPARVKKQGTVYEKIGDKYSWGRDIAIIKVEKENLPTVTLGDSDKIQVGDSIFVIGYPTTKTEELFKPESILEATLTRGVVSAKRTLRTDIETIQTDAAINHGNSGGPAYNSKGEVIGIATFGVGPEEGVEAIKFLMPINLAKEYMRELNVENEQGILDAKYEKALEAFWRRDCHTSISLMEDVLSLYPGHPYAQEYIDECNRAIMAGEVQKPLNLSLVIAIVVIIGIGVTVFLFFKRK